MAGIAGVSHDLLFENFYFETRFTKFPKQVLKNDPLALTFLKAGMTRICHHVWSGIWFFKQLWHFIKTSLFVIIYVSMLSSLPQCNIVRAKIFLIIS